jgi:hypothetical protein
MAVAANGPIRLGVISEVSAHEAPHTDVEHAHQDTGRPEAWGWHREFKLGRQIGGWMTVLVLLTLLTTTHYNRTGDIALVAGAVLVAGGLLLDRHRRKTQWRS